MTAEASPSKLFGPIFEAVQAGRLFADSKTFADAIPRRSPRSIRAEWDASPALTDLALQAFVERNFELPVGDTPEAPAGLSLTEHIEALWPLLTRSGARGLVGSAIDLPQAYVVPGGRFRELYYWDSYFTMLGLAASGRHGLVEAMIENFGDLLDRFGHIPNGTRTYYLSRSQPPVFYLMAAMSQRRDEAERKRCLRWMQIEHRYWMDGQDTLSPGEEWRRLVRLPDGSFLNRYWDDDPTPRDEAWREDVALAALSPQRSPADLWRDLRAAAESGWDFSSRWMVDGSALATTRTTRILPVDLNSLLFGLEQAISAEATGLGDAITAESFADRAEMRRRAIERHLWDEKGRRYSDFHLDHHRVSDRLTAATIFPLFTGAADATRALDVAIAARALLRPGGLVATERDTGQQWDAPNGWAPLQWIAVAGLRHYGHADLADQIQSRWLAMVKHHYQRTGVLLEKYDVEIGASGSGGEYRTETGFGWTNGVTLAFLGLSELVDLAPT